jgi:two-component system OmpR family response regulator
MRILLVEDDPMIGEAVAMALRDEAYTVDWVTDGRSAEHALMLGDHQAALMDLGLPGIDGMVVLLRLRRSGSKTPVIIITARDGIEERVRGLDLGADDYLVKPFDVKELVARLRAVTRRLGDQVGNTLRNALLSLDTRTREVTRDGVAHALSPREYALMHALMLRPGAVLSRNELETQIYGWNEEVESNAVDFLIHGIRRKLGADAIRNIRGVGWCVGPAA